MAVLHEVTLPDVVRARQVIRPHLHLTPTLSATAVGALADVRLWLKAENLQKMGSFKPRGALVAVEALTPEECARGVTAVSSGNHGQGLAFAAARRGVRCTIVVPEGTARVKLDAMRGYGAEIVEVPLVELFDRAAALERERGLVSVHPATNPHVLAGHGTVGLEALEAVPDLDAILVPVGLGGFVAGVAVAVKAVRPAARVVGVVAEGAPVVAESLAAGRALGAGRVDTIAQGIGTPLAFDSTLRYMRRLVDEVVRVSDEEMVGAMRLLLGRAKLLAEPAGAAPVAALLSGRAGVRAGEKVVCVISGGNVDLGHLKDWL